MAVLCDTSVSLYLELELCIEILIRYVSYRWYFQPIHDMYCNIFGRIKYE